MNGYEAAFPSWVQLDTPDPEGAKSFYCGLFGWYVYTLTADIGEYDVFTLGDVQGPPVGGMYTLTDSAQPTSWTVYFRSDDVQATIEAVRAAGGQELMAPTDIASLGQTALCADSQGADFGLWLPYTFQGAGVVDEPSAMCWVELACPDIGEARSFYGDVFGWKAVDRPFYPSMYTDWKVGDWSVAGMVATDEWWPPGFPPHWIPYYWVSDCDAAAERAAELGARVHVPPTDLPPGRFCVMTDPGGARLGVITPSVPDLKPLKSLP